MIRALAPLLVALSSCASAPDADRAPPPNPSASQHGATEPAAPIAASSSWPFFGDEAATCFGPADFPTPLTSKPTPMRVTEFAKQKPSSGIYVAAAYVVHEAPCQCPPEQSCGECHAFVVLADVAAAGLKQPLTPDFDVVAFLGPKAKPLDRFKLYRVVFEVCDAKEDRSASGSPALRPTVILSAEPLP